jgi:hypothetical protein
MSQKSKDLFFIVFYFSLIFLISHFLYLASESNSKELIKSPLILDPNDYPKSEGTIYEVLLSRIKAQPFNVTATLIFFLSLIHIFSAPLLTKKAHSNEKETVGIELIRFLGEVEVIFGLWVIPLMVAMTMTYDWRVALHYLETRPYTEALFVVVVMALSSTKPILNLAEELLRMVAGFGQKTVKAWWLTLLTLGPFLGSFITEPAAMTITALLLGRYVFDLKPSKSFSFATLGLLFTNISVGGVLTSFAAPPVLLISRVWHFDTAYMMSHFGWKAFVGIVLSNLLYLFLFKEEFKRLEKKALNQKEEIKKKEEEIPFMITLIHLTFLAWIVVHAHYPVVFIGSFLLFLGFYTATTPYQSPLNLKMPILVGFFIGGLVVHGALQSWWITPFLNKATEGWLMIICGILTAFNDNAEITYLASLTPDLSEGLKYAVLAGSVSGGGLTIIANAPNLPGQAILKPYFRYGIPAWRLALGALAPALIVGSCFYFLTFL